jgi:thiol-disulfide isomerase/thioredoxin/protocatechuate 3,4-dioxygenase beta subunit
MTSSNGYRRNTGYPWFSVIALDRETAQPIVPVVLKEVTVQAGLQFVSRKTVVTGPTSAALVLAKEVLRDMVLIKLHATAKVALLVGLLGTAGWLGWPKAFVPQPDSPQQRTNRSGVSNPPPRNAPAVDKQDNRFRMTGLVRVEGTGEPVAGVKVEIELGMNDFTYEFREALTDADGRYAIALPEGNARAWILHPPPGYWLPDSNKNWEFFAVTPQQPVYHKDYVVRRGTVWRLRLTSGSKREPVPSGFVSSYAQSGDSDLLVRERTDENGFASVTLPRETGRLTLSLSADGENDAMQLVIVQWDTGFRPDAVTDVKRLDDSGKPGRSQLTDESGRSATVTGPVEVSRTAGRLLIAAALPQRGSQPTGTLTGTVVDLEGRPVADAAIRVFFTYRQWGAMSGRSEHAVRTDAAGRYVLRSLPRRSYEGDPSKLTLVVCKDGYAGEDSGPFVFQPGGDGTQVADPVRLKPGISLSGKVVDPDGRPVVGAWISPAGTWSQGARTHRSGPDGRFTIPNLKPGVLFISFTFGKLIASGRYIVDGKAQEHEVRLRQVPDSKPVAGVLKTRSPDPLKVGQAAPELVVREWTDGKARSLAGFRGRVVLLDFWGIWCGGCVIALPALDRLRERFEPRGVVLLSIHTPGEPVDKIRKLYELKKVSLVSAVDDGKADDPSSGTTAGIYGVRGFPTTILIDRSGKIAFRSNDPANRPAMEALVKKLGIDAKNTITEEQANKLIEALLGEAIEKVLAQP